MYHFFRASTNPTSQIYLYVSEQSSFSRHYRIAYTDYQARSSYTSVRDAFRYVRGKHVPEKKHPCNVHDAARKSEPYEVESGFRTDVYIIPQEL